MGVTTGAAVGGDSSVILLELMAMVDPREKWWLGMRRNPKRSGEISQAAFLLKARKLGFQVAMPWGDSERYDFVVWAEQGCPIFRVQVKGTGRLYRRGYEVQPVHSTRRRGKRRYTAKEIDVVAAHVQPVDVWYLLPIAAVGTGEKFEILSGHQEPTADVAGVSGCLGGVGEKVSLPHFFLRIPSLEFGGRAVIRVYPLIPSSEAPTLRKSQGGAALTLR
jgi:hypothetical protein